MRAALLALLLAASSATAIAEVTATLTGDKLVLQNQFVRRVIEKRDEVWRTVSFSRADGSDEVRIESDEFLIRLMDGTELTIADFRAEGAPDIREHDGQKQVYILYFPRDELPDSAPYQGYVVYFLADEPYQRKGVRLLFKDGQAVDRLEVERFRTQLPCDRGGRGEPVFIGESWFAGLEYPGSQTSQRERLVTLAHFPGLARREPHGQCHIVSKRSVIGTGAKGDPLELAFSDYLDTIRRPSRNFLQYNSWYDWRGDQLTVENLVSTFEGFKENLLDPYGLKMHAFVPDDGWQNRESIWMPKEKLYPEGFAPLRYALEARGTRLGIWMPLNGTNLNADWGAEQGYEKSNQGRFYCLVGPKYNAAIREATKRIITQGNLSYYKHDFNTLRCTAEGHGHLPDNHHGHEANLDAELELLAYERELQPDIFLNITSSVWLSPWWLMHADSVWMCASDFGYDKTLPQLSPREWAMSYRDAHFHNVYTRQRRLVPISAMMTHGIIHGKRLKLGGEQETLREWSDYVVMYYGRGVQLKELYVTPELLDADWWKALGEATRWAVDNCEVLENEVMIGGNPRKGEVYGYAHWEGDRGVICLRNPGLGDRAINVPFDRSVRYRGEAGKPFRGRVIYPFVEDLPTRFTSGQPALLAVPGASVMVVELQPGPAPAVKPAAVPALTGATAEAVVDETGKGKLTARVRVPDEEMQRCDLCLIARGAGVDFDTLTLNGEAVKARRASGEGWMLHSIDLRPLRGEPAVVVARLPGGGERPFSSPDVTVSAWFIADRPVASPVGQAAGLSASTLEHLPFAISQNFRRQTVQLLPDTKLQRRREQRRITADDLATIKAAKLRIRVFDVNDQPQYRDKFIFLNGEKLIRVPANKGRLSAWQESIIDLKPEQFKLLKMENTLELSNAGGDCYKVGGMTLAVQLGDGTWVESTTDNRIHSSVGHWLYTEGEVFRGGKSGEIKLTFN